MKIYTKTGDKGKTSLVGGQRVDKTCTRIEAYGTVDELNSQLGLLITYCNDERDVRFLTLVQNRLFTIGGHLATDTSDGRHCCVVSQDMVEEVENQIDMIGEQLPPLHSFVLPGGCRAAAVCHTCRCVCRRAERRILALCAESDNVDSFVVAYVNRLSDYLFVLARKLNHDAHFSETTWEKC